MAQYIGSVSGGRGTATRLGHKRNGLTVQAAGWNFGVAVDLSYNEKTGKDEARIVLTGGTNARASEKQLGTFSAADLSK